MGPSADSTRNLVAAAILSASASAALTYAVVRWKHKQKKNSLLADVDMYSSCAGTMHAKKDPYDASPRTGYLSWDDYFMAVAFLSAQRSKDPNKQVGACIVDQNQVICGIGYNGFPRGCSDTDLPWAKKSKAGNPLQTKYPYVCHAEMNAILNKNGASVAGAKVYVTLFPCNECAKLLIQAGIKEIVYHEDKLAPQRSTSPSKDGFRPDQQYAASRKLLALAGVTLRQHRFRHPVTLRLTNHPAYPIMRSVDSAALAVERAAAEREAAAGVAAAGTPPGRNQQSRAAPTAVELPVAGYAAAVSQERVAWSDVGASRRDAATPAVAAVAAAAAAAAVLEHLLPSQLASYPPVFQPAATNGHLSKHPPTAAAAAEGDSCGAQQGTLADEVSPLDPALKGPSNGTDQHGEMHGSSPPPFDGGRVRRCLVSSPTNPSPVITSTVASTDTAVTRNEHATTAGLLGSPIMGGSPQQNPADVGPVVEPLVLHSDGDSEKVKDGGAFREWVDGSSSPGAFLAAKGVMLTPEATVGLA